MTSTENILNIKHLIDMAIGTPEIGMVNFNALHSVLYAIVEKLNLENLDINVETCKFVPVNREDCRETRRFDGDVPTSEIIGESSSGEDFPKRFTKSFGGSMELNAENAIIKRLSGGSDDTENVGNKEPEDLKEEDAQKKESGDLEVQKNEDLREVITALEQKINSVELEVVNLQQAANIMKSHNEEIESGLDYLRKDLQATKDKSDSYVEDLKRDLTTTNISAVVVNEIDDNPIEESENFTVIKAEMNGIKSEMETIKASLVCRGVLGSEDVEQTESGADPKALIAKVEDIEMDCRKADVQITDIRREMCGISDRIEDLIGVMQKGRRSSATTQLADLHVELGALKGYIDKTNENFQAISEEQAEISKHFDGVSKHLEELHKTKVDKEEIDELLSEKADYTILQRKVSVEYIDSNRHAMEKKMDEITQRMQDTEISFNAQLKTMKSEMDASHLESAFADFKTRIDRDMQALKDRFQKFSNTRSEAEALGTKNKYLRNVNCISCDQPAVMRTYEAHKVNQFDEAVATNTNSPLITFELAHVRKIGIKGYHEATDREHLLMGSHRACGGSHTKVSRMDKVEKDRWDREHRIVGPR